MSYRQTANLLANKKFNTKITDNISFQIIFPELEDLSIKNNYQKACLLEESYYTFGIFKTVKSMRRKII